MAAPVRNNERGLTLVEVTIAMAIVFIIFLGLTQSGLVALEYNIKNALRDEAVLVADNVMTGARSRSFDNLASSPGGVFFTDNVLRPLRGLTVRYGTVGTVNQLDANNLLVRVTVNWTRTGQPYSHTIDTIVRQEQP